MQGNGSNCTQTPDGLISFLKAIPDGRYRHGVRDPHSGSCCWWLCWGSTASQKADTYSGCRSSGDLERFARRHREVLNQALGLDDKRWPSDATLIYV